MTFKEMKDLVAKSQQAAQQLVYALNNLSYNYRTPSGVKQEVIQYVYDINRDLAILMQAVPKIIAGMEEAGVDFQQAQPIEKEEATDETPY